MFKDVYLELDQFSLIIYNANMKQLVDMLGHKYFFYLGQRMYQQIYGDWQGSVRPYIIVIASEANCICFR